jgi:hypothetical protein
VYGAELPEGVTVALPSLPPLQLTAVVVVDSIGTGLIFTTVVSVAVAPFLSVIVTV